MRLRESVGVVTYHGVGCVGVEVVVDEIEGICNAQKVVCVGFGSRDLSHENRKREAWRLCN